MYKLLSFILLGCILVLSNFTNLYSGNYKFVGVQKCSACHKGEKKNLVFEKWKATSHAKAYDILLTEKSQEIAKKKGLKVPANEAEECLKCHASGYMAGDVRESSIKKEDGVGCESCHGAGSGYLIKHGKNKEEGYKLGLEKKAGDVSLCKKCHNAESPTYIASRTAEHLKNMDKIKHWK